MIYKSPTTFTIIRSTFLIILLSGLFQWVTELKKRINIITDEKKESYKKIKNAESKNKKLV
jgi:hypothetical protein